jgi:exoribonuclease-2
MKLPAGRLLPWAGPDLGENVSREDAVNAMVNCDQSRCEIQEDVDALELWELSQGEIDDASANWFADLIYGDVDADRLAAVGRALMACKTHFKFRAPKFEVYPEDKALARVEEERRARERREIIDAGRPFFQALHAAWSAGRPAPQGPTDPEMAEKLKNLLMGAMADDHEVQPLWKELAKGLPEMPHLAFLLARTWGLVSEHHNMLLAQEGYEWGDSWSEPFAAAIEDIAARFESPSPERDETPYVSVDSASTRDVDDAFFMRREGDGYSLRLALACPALDWEFDGGLDRAVRERASSLYLPEGTCHMLPERLGIDACSLVAGKDRPALVLTFQLDAEMRPTDYSMAVKTVRLAENITYEDAEQRASGDEPESMFSMAYELAHHLREERVNNGAAIIVKPDPKIVLDERDGRTSVSVTTPEPCPKAQLLVSELMILANAHAAQWSRDNGVTLLYRTQDIQLSPESAGVWETPEDAFQVVKLMGPTLVETEPKRHASLGIPAYCSITSPLRRYPDFVNHAQILSHLQTGQPKWDKQALDEMLPYLSARLDAVGRIQRFRPRYWKLVYLKQNKDTFFDAVVVDENKLVTASLTDVQIYVRAPKDIFGDKLMPGQVFQVRLEKIHPLENEIRVAEAWEK